MAEKEIQIVYTVPNQKVVKVKHYLCDGTHLYAMCNLKSNKKALQELSPNTYKLYMYFSLNQDDYTFALSCQAVCNATGMSDSTYKKAVRELVDKGYLVKSKTKGLYIFYEGTENSPDRSVEINRQEEEKDTTENKKQTVQKVKKNSSRGVKNNGEIIQDNTNNNTLNNTELADAQTEAATLQTEKETKLVSEFEEMKKKVIELHEQGMSFKKDNPQIQQITGLDGQQIYKIISSYEEEKKNKQQDVHYPEETEPAPMKGVETDFDMDIDFNGKSACKGDNKELKRIIKVQVKQFLDNDCYDRDKIFNSIFDNMTGYAYQCDKEPTRLYLNGLLDALNIKQAS